MCLTIFNKIKGYNDLQKKVTSIIRNNVTYTIKLKLKTNNHL